ncbi:hypothetical protein V6N13_036617 [Hibiscus sabdariffa]|uniref:Uncharacterized protein n=1 Tax=Hibiscus sabdariffa TaxID=183260 RepID=A0ABR2S5U7_9ROSI
MRLLIRNLCNHYSSLVTHHRRTKSSFDRSVGGGKAKRIWWDEGEEGGGEPKIILTIYFINIVIALFVLRSLYSSLYIYSNNDNVVKYTPDQIRKMEESVKIRKASEPIELIKLVKRIKQIEKFKTKCHDRRVASYLHDIIYITSFVQVTSIISDKFWYTYLVVSSWSH